MNDAIISGDDLALLASGEVAGFLNDHAHPKIVKIVKVGANYYFHNPGAGQNWDQLEVVDARSHKHNNVSPNADHDTWIFKHKGQKLKVVSHGSLLASNLHHEAHDDWRRANNSKEFADNKVTWIFDQHTGKGIKCESHHLRWIEGDTLAKKLEAADSCALPLYFSAMAGYLDHFERLNKVPTDFSPGNVVFRDGELPQPIDTGCSLLKDKTEYDIVGTKGDAPLLTAHPCLVGHQTESQRNEGIGTFYESLPNVKAKALAIFFPAIIKFLSEELGHDNLPDALKPFLNEEYIREFFSRSQSITWFFYCMLLLVYSGIDPAMDHTVANGGVGENIIGGMIDWYNGEIDASVAKLDRDIRRLQRGQRDDDSTAASERATELAGLRNIFNDAKMTDEDNRTPAVITAKLQQLRAAYGRAHDVSSKSKHRNRVSDYPVWKIILIGFTIVGIFVMLALRHKEKNPTRSQRTVNDIVKSSSISIEIPASQLSESGDHQPPSISTG